MEVRAWVISIRPVSTWMSSHRETEHLASAHTGRGCQSEQHRVAALCGAVEERAELGGRPRLRSTPARRALAIVRCLHADGWARGQEPAFDGVAQRSGEELVEVVDRPRSERATATVTRGEQQLVERPEVLSPELAERELAEMGEQVVLEGGHVSSVGRSATARLRWREATGRGGSRRAAWMSPPVGAGRVAP